MAFPASPTLNQTFVEGGRTYQWTGYAWNLASRDGGAALHADATNWQTRVVAAGGTVSTPTLSAVSTFAYAIQAAGIRSLLTRLNLFCGNSLTAALVPLYTSGTTGGTAVGNATDTNVNFVSGDYSESAGLKGNGTNKYLRTGVTPTLVAPVSSLHLSISGKAFTTGASLATIIGQGDTSEFSMRSGSSSRECLSSGVTLFGALASSESHQVLSRTGTAALALYCGGALVNSSTTSTSNTTSTRDWAVFAHNQGGSFTRHNACNLWCYSIGQGLTAEQVRQFSLALQNFNFALGRL